MANGFEQAKYNKYKTCKSGSMLLFKTLTAPSYSHLYFHPICQVAGIAQAGHDKALCSKLVVNITAPDGHRGLRSFYVFNAHRTGNGGHDMDFFGAAFLFQKMDGFY